MITQADIQEMADIIAERFDPERIILFGSYANGTATDDSDVDLVVVINTDEDLREKTADIELAVRTFPVDKDIIVRTPQLFDQGCRIYWTVFSKANKNGKLLYAKAS
jgi:predicted nucleotidyltransferase